MRGDAVAALMARGDRPLISGECGCLLRLVIEACWDSVPEERPIAAAVAEVVDLLAGVRPPSALEAALNPAKAALISATVLQVQHYLSPGKEVRATQEARRRKLSKQTSKDREKDQAAQAQAAAGLIQDEKAKLVSLETSLTGKVTVTAVQTDSDSDEDDSGIDPELWAKAVSTALAFRAFRAGSRVSKRQRAEFARVLCGQWDAVGTDGDGEHVTELLLIEAIPCKRLEASFLKPHLEPTDAVITGAVDDGDGQFEDDEDDCVLQNGVVDFETGSVSFDQIYADGDITHWEARYDYGSQLLADGNWSGECDGKFIATRKGGAIPEPEPEPEPELEEEGNCTRDPHHMLISRHVCSERLRVVTEEDDVEPSAEEEAADRWKEVKSSLMADAAQGEAVSEGDFGELVPSQEFNARDVTAEAGQTRGPKGSKGTKGGIGSEGGVQVQLVVDGNGLRVDSAEGADRNHASNPNFNFDLPGRCTERLLVLVVAVPRWSFEQLDPGCVSVAQDDSSILLVEPVVASGRRKRVYRYRSKSAFEVVMAVEIARKALLSTAEAMLQQAAAPGAVKVRR